MARAVGICGRGFFVVATAWSWWRWRERLAARREERRAEPAAARTQ